MKLREQMPELVGATTWLNGEVTKAELVGKTNINPLLVSKLSFM